MQQFVCHGCLANTTYKQTNQIYQPLLKIHNKFKEKITFIQLYSNSCRWSEHPDQVQHKVALKLQAANTWFPKYKTNEKGTSKWVRTG